MMPQHWIVGVRESHRLDRHGELARYLNWEYGGWTVQGFLNGSAAKRKSSRLSGRIRFIDRIEGLAEAIKVRVTTKPRVRWGQELALVAQWKRGELPTPELVDRLEELDRKARIGGPSPSE